MEDNTGRKKTLKNLSILSFEVRKSSGFSIVEGLIEDRIKFSSGSDVVSLIYIKTRGPNSPVIIFLSFHMMTLLTYRIRMYELQKMNFYLKNKFNATLHDTTCT